MDRETVIQNFDPNGVGNTQSGIFGLPFDYQQAQIVILPVPWDVTTSNLSGTAYGPQAIFDYSPQIDLCDPEILDTWKAGIYMENFPSGMLERCQELRTHVDRYIDFLEHGGNAERAPWALEILQKANKACAHTKSIVKESAKRLLKGNKIPIVLGGDHSSPLGLIEALGAQYDAFGILHIDAHFDLRNAYEGFVYSHASIMYRAIKGNSELNLISVGVRDYCKEELDFLNSLGNRGRVFFDVNMKNRLLKGEQTWFEICEEIVSTLPDQVYISFDIDGLQPQLCPDTGTPVPGGFSFEQVSMLLMVLAKSGKKIIGADLCEVSPGNHFPIEDPAKQWNANVGARVLYKLCGVVGLSQGLLELAPEV